MGAVWIIISILCVSAWESAGITNKGRPLLQEGPLRSFRHIPGPSGSVTTDWEVGLREAVNQALLRERYQDYNLRERLLDAPLIGRQDVITPFGDIVILARGQLYVAHGGNFLFVQDQYQNDCDDCHNPRPRCGRSQCQVWQPDENEHLLALWTVKRLRHRNRNHGHYYELEYIISPITPTINEFVMRNGHFDYGIPGHIFVVRNDKEEHHQPDLTFVDNRRLPHHHIKPEVIIGIAADGERHILQSYPGFYTSFPVHPTYHQNRYSTNDPREIELYKELIKSLASKTSSTKKAETGPHKFSLNGYTEPTKSTKPNYDLFPATQNSVAELSTKPLAGTTVKFPQQNIVNKPPATPTKPTELSTEEIFSIFDTMKPTGDNTPKVTQPITTIHYFTPIGEEDLVTDDVTEMKKITLGTFTKTPEYKSEESGSDFLFPGTETTLPSRTTQKYYKPTTVTEDVSNILEEPASSSTQTTKQYQTTVARTKPVPLTTITGSTSPKSTTRTTTLKPTTRTITLAATSRTTTLKPTTRTTTLKPTTRTTSTTRQSPSTTKSRSSKMTTIKFIVPEVIKITTETPTTTPVSRTESFIVKTTTNKVTTNITTPRTTSKIPSSARTRTTTEVPSSTTIKTTTLKLRTTKTKLSNLTGFIASTSATIGTKKITTYKPKFTTTKLTTKQSIPETTTFTTEALPTKTTTRQWTTVPVHFTRTTQPQRPIIDLDYTLLEDISPTEPMAVTLKPKENQPTSLSTKMDVISTITPYTTITTTQMSNEFNKDTESTTKPETSTESSFTLTINTPDSVLATTEATQANTVTHENETDSAATQEEIETSTQSITKTTLPGNSLVSNIYSTDASGTEIPTITTTYKSDTISTTSDASMQPTESTTTLSTNKKPTVSKLKPSTTTNDFLTENGNEKPSFTKPDKTDFDDYDIFGATKAQTKPTKASTIKEITESDLASDLFGSRESEASKPDHTVPKGTKIIYSNFFEASTSEYETQTESYETTTNFKPLTSQSYATSISFKVEKNETATESESTNTTPSTTTSDTVPTESMTTTTKTSKLDTKKTFDRLALQVINHAKSIDYLSGNNNKTNRAKYKRRKTYVPKNRRLNRKQAS